jgi:hypothetical protein
MTQISQSIQFESCPEVNFEAYEAEKFLKRCDVISHKMGPNNYT